MDAPWQEEARKVMIAMREGSLDRASLYVNLALRRFPDEPFLHTLNGFIYEGLAGQNGQNNLSLAETAYHTALQYDPNNWYALYAMGKLQLSLQKYTAAQRYFARSLKLKPDNADLLYHMAFASYYAKDLPCAYVSIQKLLTIRGEAALPRELKAAALIATAINQKDEVENYLKPLRETEQISPDFEERLKRWQSLHQTPLKGGFNQKWLRKTSSDDGDDDSSDASWEQSDDKDVTANSNSNPVIIFECVLILLEENISTKKGQNLLESFQDGVLVSVKHFYDNSIEFTREIAGNMMGEKQGQKHGLKALRQLGRRLIIRRIF